MSLSDPPGFADLKRSLESGYDPAQTLLVGFPCAAPRLTVVATEIHHRGCCCYPPIKKCYFSVIQWVAVKRNF